ncbi:MAG: Ku protein [Pseudomonadota bacterium]
MPRAIWKGAISFGLVHIPIGLYPAASEGGIDFDWLDKRSMDPVGYRRINKRTGREIAKENIVKGVKVEGDEYVVLGDDEIKAAYPRTTQTIEIESFVKASEIPLIHFDRPYYLEPLAKGEKVYVLLREAMLAAGVVGVARVVLHTKEYLSALIPSETGLVLHTLRWAGDIRATKELQLPSGGRKLLKDSDLKMARQLIADMTDKWQPDAYEDKFTQAIHALVAKRQKAGATEKVEPLEDSAPPASNVVDLTALLAQSLRKKPAAPVKTARTASRAGTRKAARA